MFLKEKFSYIGNLLKAFIKSIIILLMFSIIFAILSESLKNVNVSYVISYILIIAYFIFIEYNYLKECINNIKNTNYKELINTILISALIIVISQIIYNVIVNWFGNVANNVVITNDMLLSSKLIVSIQFILLAPITEEFIFRSYYKDIKEHKLITYIFYSLIFAFCHINFLNLNDYIFLISYFLLSLGIGYSFYKKENIFLSMFMHMLNNAVMVLIILFL